ncbi:MAG TPA: GAF and ANTAR domain-containing protein [Kribbella sp.]|nr:GAF and ANTAR domain-containing protein [Kribbella sp.]
MSDEILELAQELSEISRLVADDDVTSTLSRFVTRVVQTVADCDEASVAVLTNGEPEIVARHHRIAEAVAEPARATLGAQLVASASPLRDTLQYGEPHRIGDLAADFRWDDFAAAAINAGYRSCVFLPLPTRGSSAAAFSLFSIKPDAFGSTSYDVVLLFALNAGVAFDNVQLYDDSAKLVEQLHIALGTRAAIGQAQGILMHRYGLTSDIAFKVLTRCSQNSNVKLRALSLEFIDAQNHGTLDDQLRKYGLGTEPSQPNQPS